MRETPFTGKMRPTRSRVWRHHYRAQQCPKPRAFSFSFSSGVIVELFFSFVRPAPPAVSPSGPAAAPLFPCAEPAELVVPCFSRLLFSAQVRGGLGP